MEERYRHLNNYYKNKFGERVLKICVDGGFTCPNRDGKCGVGGCVFCGEKIQENRLSITNQIQKHLDSYRGQRANKFIVFFQNFTNTYDSIENLKKKYDEALSVSDKIIGLSIATRPDCLDEEIVKLISLYKEKYYVQVELGFQTANENTADLINRGYKNQVFTNAVKLLNKYNIDVVVHIMVGLLNETKNDVINTVKFLNKHNISGVKIHSTFVTKNTKLCELYENKKYTPITLEEYIDCATEMLTLLNPNVVIHRISGDAPKSDLVAPEWNLHKKLILNGIDKIMKEKDIFQGQFYIKE